MDVNDVPQDNSSTYSQNKKAIYATDAQGRVSIVGSSGWDAEETVTKQALDDLQNLAKDAYFAVKNEEKSPLYFHMYAQRMDVQVLSEATGFFKWTIQRDFIPQIFKKISQKRVLVYADALGKTTSQLQSLPESYDA